MKLTIELTDLEASALVDLLSPSDLDFLLVNSGRSGRVQAAARRAATKLRKAAAPQSVGRR